jgi:hypothetical protein
MVDGTFAQLYIQCDQTFVSVGVAVRGRIYMDLLAAQE